MDNLFYEYLAIIEPSHTVATYSIRMQEHFKKYYKLESGEFSRPHFTVLNIVQLKEYESRLTNCLQRIVPNITPFQIELDGFGCFNKSVGAIYLNVKDFAPFATMVNYLKGSLRPILKSKKGISPYFTTTPHLTIVKGLSENDMAKVWPSCQEMKYQSTTNANRLRLLGRGKIGKYEVIGEYPFLGNGPLNVQMALF